MSVTFHDLQQLDNPMNGARLETVAAITELFRSLRERKPFLFELRGSNGFMLTIGFAGNCGSVQYSPRDGSPPYLMAVADDAVDDGKFVEFLAGNTPTPIPRRFCLPTDQVEKIAAEFLTHGGKSGAIAWEGI
jgi:hypothetical protein